MQTLSGPAWNSIIETVLALELENTPVQCGVLPFPLSFSLLLNFLHTFSLSPYLGGPKNEILEDTSSSNTRVTFFIHIINLINTFTVYSLIFLQLNLLVKFIIFSHSFCQLIDLFFLFISKSLQINVEFTDQRI